MIIKVCTLFMLFIAVSYGDNLAFIGVEHGKIFCLNMDTEEVLEFETKQHRGVFVSNIKYYPTQKKVVYRGYAGWSYVGIVDLDTKKSKNIYAAKLKMGKTVSRVSFSDDGSGTIYIEFAKQPTSTLPADDSDVLQAYMDSRKWVKYDLSNDTWQEMDETEANGHFTNQPNMATEVRAISNQKNQLIEKLIEKGLIEASRGKVDILYFNSEIALCKKESELKVVDASVGQEGGRVLFDLTEVVKKNPAILKPNSIVFHLE